jgi:flagellar hook-associated protein 1 FlgK
MGLTSALHVGQSAILASQAAIQVAGNNMANAATPGYHRQVAGLTPGLSNRIGSNSFVGTGVKLRDITRAVDTALQTRVRGAIAREARTEIDQRFLGALEALQNELSGNDISSKLSEFINSFSELANNPNDDAVRSLVLRQATGVSDYVQNLRGEYGRLRDEADRALAASVEKADGLLEQIAAVNAEIAQTEQGAGQANGLRDRRDQLVNELSELLDVSTIEQPNGSVDVLVGSLPVVLAGGSRGLELRTKTVGDDTKVEVRIKADGSTLSVEDGQIGALLGQRANTIDPAIDVLDTFARELIFQANRVHSQGQGKSGWSAVTGLVQVANPTTALSADATELPFDVRNGSFAIHITNTATGLRESALVTIDPATQSLNDLVASINASGLGNLSASVTGDGRLSIAASAGFEVSFSEDSSGVLAGLGVNALFAGSDATDIAVNEALLDDPRLLASGLDHVPGSNGSALAMVGLESLSIDALGGRSLRTYWQAHVNGNAVRTAAANDAAESAAIVRQGLEAQELAVGGVSLDEESVDLITYQRQFQAAARFISVIDEAMQTLLSIA